MGFLMTCTNKGCYKTMEPLLNLEDNKVYCTYCNKYMVNVSPFTVNQMKHLNQVKKSSPARVAFSVTCPKCSEKALPKISGDIVICSNCNAELNNILPNSIIHTIKQFVK